MAGWPEITELMGEIAGTLGAAEVTELPDNGLWYIGDGHGPVVVVTYAPEGDQLLLRALLGKPAPALREATYDTLLAYNGRHKETGGGWLGLDGPAGEVVLIFAAPAEGLEADALRGLLLDLLAVAARWRDYVTREPAADQGIDAAPELLRFGAIRG